MVEFKLPTKCRSSKEIAQQPAYSAHAADAGTTTNPFVRQSCICADGISGGSLRGTVFHIIS